VGAREPLGTASRWGDLGWGHQWVCQTTSPPPAIGLSGRCVGEQAPGTRWSALSFEAEDLARGSRGRHYAAFVRSSETDKLRATFEATVVGLFALFLRTGDASLTVLMPSTGPPSGRGRRAPT